ncbi:MAG: hypothetical protein ABW056_06070 [Thermoanaerobaculia bacterium]
MSARLSRLLLAAGFLVALAVRLWLLAGFHGNYDTESYALVAEIARTGGDLYRDTTRYNYSPLWAGVCVAVEGAARTLGTSPIPVFGALLLLADLATAVLVFVLARRRRSAEAAALAALLFFANPVSILVSSRHLQFDGLAILFLLAAILFSERARDVSAAAALSVSLLIKHVTGLHPLLFRRRPGAKGLLPVVAPYLVFAASLLPYARSWRDILQNVVLYRGVTGNYGIEVMVLIPGVPDWAPVPIFFAAVAVAIVRLSRVELVRASLLLFLVILVFAPGFGRQYCVWPIALGALFAGPGFYLYSVVAGAFLVGAIFPEARAAVSLPGWYGPFWASVAWLAWELRGTRRARQDAAAAGEVKVKIPAGPHGTVKR